MRILSEKVVLRKRSSQDSQANINHKTQMNQGQQKWTRSNAAMLAKSSPSPEVNAKGESNPLE